ncbi:FtsX-like permease family protein [Actinoplanes sp. NPDC051346]|uniref:FtsX-like permease family protein n=1 Tax=Actinoplanes sp. NPDC051346 TaxID=3155048 RepID=UPI003413E104
MIRFGIRLALASGRETMIRLVMIAAAVALGVGLLLTTLAGVNAVQAQYTRSAWLYPSGGADVAVSTADPVLWTGRDTYYDRATISRLDVAATGPTSPIPPGIPRLPGPGEFYASPALDALLRVAPANQLGDRFAGRQIGIIGDSALPGPDALLAIVGNTPDALARVPDVQRLTSIGTELPASRVAAFARALDLVLSVVAGGLIFPLLMFIGNATRLSAARREQRFAAMRLVGATPGQVSVVAAVEATISAAIGAVLGFGLFFLIREPAAAIPFAGAAFFPEDMSLTVADALAVLIGVPAAAALAARFSLRRVRVSPLGVSRRVTPRPPSAFRLIPLGLGLAELGFFVVVGVPATSHAQVLVFLPGFLVIMVGLVVAGPWLTMVGARAVARRTKRAASLIAARRLADNPKSGFRSVSGLILALFVASVAIGVITTINIHRGGPLVGPSATSLVQRTPAESAVVPDGLRLDLRSIPGVQRVAVIRDASNDLPAMVIHGWTLTNLVSCADIAGHPDFGSCAPGAEVAAVIEDLSLETHWPASDKTWPTVHVSTETLARLPIKSVVVGTDGSSAALERARTTLAIAYPQAERYASTDAEHETDVRSLLNGWRQLADVVILASLVVAGSSLAVSAVGGLSDRRRPFGMLRLTGVPLRLLRRVIALETAVPLLIAAGVAIGTGFLAAHLFLTAQMSYSLRLPTVTYFVFVLGGLAVSLGIVASTLPLLRRITGPETVRNE